VQRLSEAKTSTTRSIRTPAEVDLDEAVGTQIHREREALVAQVAATLDRAMVALSIVWVALLIIELAGGGLPPVLDAAVWVIWAIFVVDFVLEFSIAPDKTRYLRTHWVTALSLLLPAVRIVRAFAALRVLRAARVVRSIGLLRILATVNRGLASLRQTAARRGLGYVIGATVIVMLLGAGGMSYFEGSASAAAAVSRSASIASYSDALWWTAYAMTTGATSQPLTPEGKFLGWLLTLYGLAIFGYLTAILASHFVGQERSGAGSGRPENEPSVSRGSASPTSG
jgi:voltage-gated potassium channel